MYCIPPVIVIAAFFIHWITLKTIDTSAGRLPFCRGAYMALSMQVLIYAWGLYFLFSLRHGVSLPLFLPLGMTFSSLGDFFNLQFPSVTKRTGEPIFFGILSFAVAQIFYILAFLDLVPLPMLASGGFFYPILAVLVLAPAVIFRFRVYDKDRPKTVMMGAFFYGFILGAMAAVAVTAALLEGGYWYAVAAGALFFLLSDAVMGETTIRGKHPRTEYQIPWGTYLIAQVLIHFGIASVVLSQV